MAVTTNIPYLKTYSDSSTINYGNLPGGGSQPQSQLNFDANDVIVTVTICVIIVCLGSGFLLRTYCLRRRYRNSLRSSRSRARRHHTSTNGNGNVTAEHNSNDSNSLPTNNSNRMPAYMGSANSGFDPSEPPPPPMWFTLPPSYEDAIKCSSPFSASKKVEKNATNSQPIAKEETTSKSALATLSVPKQCTSIVLSPSISFLPSYEVGIKGCEVAVDNTLSETNKPITDSGPIQNSVCDSSVAQSTGVALDYKLSSTDVDTISVVEVLTNDSIACCSLSVLHHSSLEDRSIPCETIHIRGNSESDNQNSLNNAAVLSTES